MAQWNPLHDLVSLQDRMNRLFEDATQRSFRGLMVLLGSVLGCAIGVGILIVLFAVSICVPAFAEDQKGPEEVLKSSLISPANNILWNIVASHTYPIRNPVYG